MGIGHQNNWLSPVDCAGKIAYNSLQYFKTTMTGIIRYIRWSNRELPVGVR